MSSKNKVLKNTCLALATGLFTGGVVTSIATTTYSLTILTKAYLPAMVLYFSYVTLSAFENKISKKWNKTLLVLTLIILFLFFLSFYLI